MDINRCAEDILVKYLKNFKEVCHVSQSLLKNIVKKYVWDEDSKIVILGYQRDVDRFMKCVPKSRINNVVCEFIEPQDWMNMPGKEFHNEEAVKRIAQFSIDKLVIVSEDFRYLLQMYLVGEEVTYEIVDIYELIKREYSKVLVTGIGCKLWKKVKWYVRLQNYDWLERIAIFNKIKYVRKLIDSYEKKCDNYDGILVKKYYYKKASKKSEKQYYLAELIVNYIMIKDFQNAFFYIDEYTDLFGEEDKEGKIFLNIKKQYIELLSQMKKQLSKRGGKDIIIFWCDALPYSDFVSWKFLKEIKKDSLVFENAYTHIPYTHTTAQAIFIGQPFYEGKMYRASTAHGPLIENGKTFDLLEKNNYEICDVGLSYLGKSKKTNYIIKSSQPPATMHLWEVLAQLLIDDGKKKFIICHMACELHHPYWNGESKKLRVDPGNLLDDISEFIVQRRESAAYFEKQMLYYYNFLGEDACKIFMSDHGIGGGPAYIESRLHAFCFVKDKNVKKGNYKKYFSYLNFYELIDYIIEPTEGHFDKIFSDYVLVQNDHPYSSKFCNLVLNKIDRNEDVKWKEWMGFRGIIKDGYKLIHFPGGHEIWFDQEEREIKVDEIPDQNLVEFMKNTVGNEFPDIYAEEHYVNTRILFEKLHLDYKDKE